MLGPGAETRQPTQEQEIAYRRNREESLQLCNDFRAFYAANAAYHLDL